MLIELFFVGFDKDDAISGQVFDSAPAAWNCIRDEYGSEDGVKLFSATVGVNASDLVEETE